jgi:hypothetical protein
MLKMAYPLLFIEMLYKNPWMKLTELTNLIHSH